MNTLLVLIQYQYQMNFIKNSFNKLFGGKTEQKEATKNEVQKVDIPQQQLKQLFELAAQTLTHSKQPVSDQIKLRLYALYKQATIGDCNTPKPALFEFVNKAKWDAWDQLKGMPRPTAMKTYISTSVQADKNIQERMLAELQGQDYIENEMKNYNKYDTFGMKMVEQEDFSDSYSHPYFKNIEKGESIENISHELLLQINNSPKVYPLHFAIDKERVDLVQAFLPLLTVEEIKSMKDQDGTGILEYAQLIENEEILELIKIKLG